MGRKAIAQLALEAATYRFFQRATERRPPIGHLHLHAAAVGGHGEAIADRTGANTDITHWAASCTTSASSSCRSPSATRPSTRSRRAQAGAERAAAERKLLGVDHAEAGALVARASQVEEPVEGHRLPSRRPRRPPGRLPRGACVIIADEVVGLARARSPTRTARPALETLGLCDEDFGDLARRPSAAARAAHAMAARVAELERQARVDDRTGAPIAATGWPRVRRAVADREPGSV